VTAFNNILLRTVIIDQHQLVAVMRSITYQRRVTSVWKQYELQH